MTMISQYYAKVGVDTDRKSLSSVDSYLGSIERKFQGFQRKLRRGNHFNLEFSGNEVVKSLNKSLRKGSGQGAVLDLGRVSFKHDSLIRSLNNSLRKASAAGRELGLDAKLSGTSLQNIRRQLRELSAVVNVNANVRGVTGGVGSGRSAVTGLPNQLGADRSFPHNVKREDPTGNRTMSKYYNPIMLGGATGAVARYGLHALPLFGGVLGFNALSNRAIEEENQRQQLRATIGVYGGSGDFDNYMKNLNIMSENLAVSTRDLVPNFNELLGASIGSPLEDYAMRSFNELTKLTMSMGLSAKDSQETISTFTNMLLTQKSTGQRLSTMRAEKVPPVVQLMADAVTEGDTSKLIEILSEERLDVNQALPKLLEVMRERSDPFLRERAETLAFQRDRLEKLTSDIFTESMASGGEEGLRLLFRALADNIGVTGESLGSSMFELSKGVSVAISSLGDLNDFLKTGEWSEGSIGDYLAKKSKSYIDSLLDDSHIKDALQGLFPDVDVQGAIDNFSGGASKSVSDAFKISEETMGSLPESLGGEVKGLFLSSVEAFKNIFSGDVEGLGKQSVDVWATREAMSEINRQSRISGKKLSPEQELDEINRIRKILLDFVEVERKAYEERHGTELGFWSTKANKGFWSFFIGHRKPTEIQLENADKDVWDEGRYISNDPNKLPANAHLFMNPKSPLYIGDEAVDLYLSLEDRRNLDRTYGYLGGENFFPELMKRLSSATPVGTVNLESAIQGGYSYDPKSYYSRYILGNENSSGDRGVLELLGVETPKMSLIDEGVVRAYRSLSSWEKEFSAISVETLERMRNSPETFSGSVDNRKDIRFENKFDLRVEVNVEDSNLRQIADDTSRKIREALQDQVEDLMTRVQLATN